MTDKLTEFAKELQGLLNKHCCENASNTPDFILARFLYGCLAVFDLATQQRDTWFGNGLQRLVAVQTDEPTVSQMMETLSAAEPIVKAVLQEAAAPARKDYNADGALRCTQCGQLLPAAASSSLREALAAYAHEAWSGWMKYLFSKCVPVFRDVPIEPVPDYGEGVREKPDGMRIPVEAVERWMRQMRTPYAVLPEAEKESDRVEADKMLEICRRHAPLKFAGWFLGKRGAVEAVLNEAKRELKCHRPTRELDIADVVDALDKAGLLQ